MSSRSIPFDFLLDKVVVHFELSPSNLHVLFNIRDTRTLMI